MLRRVQGAHRRHRREGRGRRSQGRRKGQPQALTKSAGTPLAHWPTPPEDPAERTGLIRTISMEQEGTSRLYAFMPMYSFTSPLAAGVARIDLSDDNAAWSQM